MRKFHIKSIILGIGIGIVLTSIISMVYSVGYQSSQTLSEQEIKERALQLGMVDRTKLIKDDKPKDLGETPMQNANIPNRSKDLGEAHIQNAKTPDNTEDVEEGVEVEIKKGDTAAVVAKKLFKCGLIEDIKKFETKLIELNLDTEIEVGRYKIKKNSDLETIIDKIT